MINWNDLNNTELLLYRKPEIEIKYLEFKQEILKKDNNICEYILDNILKNKMISMNINKFPYDVNRNVIHWIIWNKRKHNIKKYRKMVYKLFNPKYYDIIFRINKLEHQSIPEINHCHLFIKNKITFDYNN